MIDLFGLGKKPEPEEGQPAEEHASASKSVEPAAEASPRGSHHKLWAFLLVLDSVFVIVFAGAVAAKVYQHWKAPALVPVPAAHRRPGKADAAPAPAPAPAPVAEAPKAPEPPKPEPPKPAPAPAAPAKASAKAEPGRPPKPSMLTEAPKRRDVKPADLPAAKPASAPAAAPAASADGRIKAIKTEFKISAPKAKAVELVGAFIVRGGRREMSRQDDGTWTVSLYLNPGSYRYFFSVDKKKQLDPENPHSEKGASLLTVP